MNFPKRRLLFPVAVVTFALVTLLASAATYHFWGDDPDLPSFGKTGEMEIDKEDYMRRRAEGIGFKRGINKDAPFDPQARPAAVREMELQEKAVLNMPKSHAKDSLLAAWVPLGPAPIPNGQTLTVSTPVSGRTISIAVHPTNPNIVYVGAAQGGLYRSTDGGTNWTPLMDGALSLAIGAIAIAPSQPDTIYVGTGETGFCGDCFFGVGVYRIDNASTAAPVISGPFNDEAITDNDIFTGRGIGAIVVHPTNPAIIFVADGSGIGGSGGVAFSSLPNRGLWRSTDATSADPSFTKMAMTGVASANNATVDVVMDPGNPDLVICSVADALGNGDGGVYRSINASAAVPTFTRTFVTNPANSNSRTELALNRTAGVVTVYAASGTNGGTIQRSLDGGATWAQRIDNNFCTAQCFYDIGVAVDPTNADIMYVGGSPNLAFGRSINGGTSFTTNATTAVGLHVDSHVITIAPSLPTTIYFGSDGGIYKTTNSGTNWTPLNNTQYSATEFTSLAIHPIDRYFSIGGTQDNGTNFYQPSQVWTNTEGGDGGFTQIDQNAVNNTAVTMYHTFFNQTNAMGYSRSLNAGSSWAFFGCGFGGSTPNGMTCAVPAGGILFYAPMERGPGNPNTLYFGSNVLYRSADSGTTMLKVSQEGTMGGAISAIGISPQNDAVRILGTSTGGIFGTTTGANPLVNLDALGQIPDVYVGRTVVDPNNVNTAYVTLEVFGVNNLWKTTNLNAVNPTWTAVVGGLPQVPVSAFVIDPQDSNALYAGTDIGVYQSLDGGTSWLPYGTGLPRVAVFDAEISNVHRILRIATHGRGLFEIGIPGTGIPVPRPAGDGSSGPGGASALVAETCAPNNGAVDSGEQVTISYSITNVGGGPTTALTATLQPTGGVMLSAGPQVQNYGAIPAGGTVTRNFTFTATGPCAATVTPTFQLQDGAINYGIVSTSYTMGALVTASAFTENFDAVVAAALPAGWTTAQTGGVTPWTTTTTFSDTAPNSAATDGLATPADNSLTTPTIAIPTAPGVGVNPDVRLSFRNFYNTEGGFDGGILEISIAAGPFVDIITAGGTFVSGGYNGAIGVTDSVLTGSPAWTGNSGGFITTTVILPPASYGQNAQLRWRTAYDTGTNPAGGGMRVDTVSIFTSTRVCCGVPTAVDGNVSGQIVDAAGNPVAGVSMRMSGSQNRLTMTDANGNYRFDNVETNGVYTITPLRTNYSFNPSQRSFNQLGFHTEAAFTASVNGSVIDPLSASDYFVRQQYVDFLNREPDEAGLNFWVNNIESCGGDSTCRANKRTETSAAFFLSIEFQQTGYLVYRMYQSAYGTMPGAPVPVDLANFQPDSQDISRGVIVNRTGWEELLDSNKRAYALEFVQRARFTSAYPDSLTPAEFIDTLFNNAGVTPSSSDRAAAIAEFNSAQTSSDVLARGRALRKVAENNALAQKEFNKAFVLMQYFGYLRRDPNSGPDGDYAGYNFWLEKLDQFGGDFRSAEMVKAFLISGEYRNRFPR